MADLSDVETALRNLIGAALYPAGVPANNISLVCGKAVRVYRDWPVKTDLDKDLKAGVVNVSIFAQPNMTRRDSRYPRRWQLTGPATPPTLTWMVAGGTATLTGTVSVPQVAALVTGRADAVYPVQASDTLASIAAALAAQLAAAGVQASAAGPAVTVAGASVVGRIGVPRQMVREIRRQDQGFLVTAWCADADSRDAVCAAIDAAMAAVQFLPMPDGTGARLTYRSTGSSDRAENDGLFRRDLAYTVEYATTQTMTAPQAVVWRIDQQTAAATYTNEVQ